MSLWTSGFPFSPPLFRFSNSPYQVRQTEMTAQRHTLIINIVDSAAEVILVVFKTLTVFFVFPVHWYMQSPSSSSYISLCVGVLSFSGHFRNRTASFQTAVLSVFD